MAKCSNNKIILKRKRDLIVKNQIKRENLRKFHRKKRELLRKNIEKLNNDFNNLYYK